MTTIREKQKAEAVKRLELMGIRENVRRKFEEDGTVMFCNNEQYRPVDEEMAEEIRQFEQKHDATVFLAVRMFHVLGDLDALLFVAKVPARFRGFRHGASSHAAAEAIGLTGKIGCRSLRKRGDTMLGRAKRYPQW